MNYWTTKDRQIIQVKDMKLSHVENTLKMLIKDYTIFCISRGAKHACGINVDRMSESEKRDMLDKTCANRSYLKRLVAKDCFGYDIYSEIIDQ